MPRSIPGLTRRGGRAYYHRTFPAAVGGDRIYKSLECDADAALAAERAQAVGVLWNRGDWPILRRWQAGDVHISEIVRAVREGSWERLRRLNADGYLLGDAVRQHMARTEATRADSTVQSHRTCCDMLLARWGADKPMHEITTADCEVFLHEPKATAGDAPWAPNTQKTYRARAHALWQYAMDREREEAERQGAAPTLTRNPWAGARIPDERRVRPAVLTAPEIRDLLANEAVVGTPAAALLACAAWAGLRLQEITHLRLGLDVVLDGADPRLIVQSRKGEKRAHEWTTKSPNSERDVPSPPALVAVVREHLRRGYGGDRYLIRAANQADGPISPATAQNWTRAAFEAAGIHYGRDGEGLTLHSLRHSYATMLLSEGVSIAAVAELMGDTQEVVLSTYSHAIPNDRARALRIIEDAAGGGV